MSLNEIVLVGNAGRDAELRYAASGAAVTGFSLAVNENRRGPGGEWETSTLWVQVVTFGERAERLAETIRKGAMVAVVGRLAVSDWTNDAGVKSTRLEVIAHTVRLLLDAEALAGARESRRG